MPKFVLGGVVRLTLFVWDGHSCPSPLILTLIVPRGHSCPLALDFACDLDREGHGFRGCGKTHLYFVRDEIQGGMRGNQDEQEEVFSYIPLEKRVPQGHPLRRVR